MDEKQYVKTINGYYIKDEEAQTDILGLGEDLTTLTGRVSDLEDEVDSSNTGLLDRVSDLEDEINNASTGLDKRVDDLESSTSTINSKLAIMNTGIKLSLAEDHTINQTQSYESLVLGTTDLDSSSVLSNENGTVKIGAGVHHVLVSAEVYWFTLGDTIVNKDARIYRNNTIITSNNIYGGTDYIHSSLPAVIVAVQQNDIISLSVSGEAGDLIKAYNSGTFLNVVVLD